jgi:hypothetical protein
MANIKSWVLPLVGAVLLSAVAALPTLAQTAKTPVVTFSTWVEIPGGVLPAGHYIFNVSKHTVRIYDQVSGILVATRETVAAKRDDTSSDTTIRFDAGISPNPAAVMAWFPNGSRNGQQFIYTVRENQQLQVPVALTAALIR